MASCMYALDEKHVNRFRTRGLVAQPLLAVWGFACALEKSTQARVHDYILHFTIRKEVW